MEKVEKIVAEEGGYFTLKTDETKTQSQTQSLNLNTNSVKENRELGARPKQNGSCNSLRAMDVDPPQSLVKGVSD
ncbi:GTPase IMAP family member 4-like protein [Labeo rohita]|uniref:GTPase IMAP family member 4-like protein n=2 Tax=Labeo rohita TaxID=84645 RepID=A0A498NBI3_LABRO|nr:GTPase IMAP family member 4-like protein [Labeo rohita]